MIGGRELIGREARAALPVAIATMLAVICLVGSNFILSGVVGGGGDAEAMRDIDGDRGGFILSFVVQAVGFLLLGAPLIYLFRATAARSEGVRGQMIGVLFVAPLFLAAFAVLGGLSTLNAATDFLAANITGTDDAANDAARDAINDSSLRPAAAGFGLAGQIGFAVAMAYTCMQALKAGLLARFWGALGAALGVVSILFFQFALLWFIYLGLLIAGWVPGGRPPAWAEGRAIPWPKAGEQFAEEHLTGEPQEGDEEAEAIDVDDVSGRDSDEPARNGSGDLSGPVRKRKRRS